jgi:hypothetical protein
MITGLLCAFTLSAFAAPATEASVENLLKLLNFERVNGTISSSMQDSMRKMLRSTLELLFSKATDEQKKSLDARLDAHVQMITADVSWANRKSAYIKVYQKHFSEEEVTSLATFFSSPDGHRYVEKSPEIQRDLFIELQAMNEILKKKIEEHTLIMTNELKGEKAP